MIDYNELDKFYIGNEMHVISNCGGVLLELSEDVRTLFYKLSDDYYADVNHKGRIVQVLRKGAVIKSRYVVQEESLVQVSNKHDISKNSTLVKRLGFKKTNYVIKRTF